jgi:hypothetical protein
MFTFLFNKLYYPIKRYLMFIALLDQGFGACKKDEVAKSKMETTV